MKQLLRLLLCALLLAASAAPALAQDNQVVVLETSKGDIMIMLYADKAPKTVENFLTYVDAGFYDGTIFHRVIPGFVVQGGGLEQNMRPKATMPPIALESSGLDNKRGTISMARASNPDSATSQFFLNLANNAALDASTGNPGYTVFGKIIRGMEVVDDIAKVPTATRAGNKDVPIQPVFLKKAYRYKEQQ